MNYSESVSYVENAAVFGAAKQGLTNIRELLHRLGDPQDSFPSVHVAGTNGKGSVCAFLNSILSQKGLKVGLYTSPYLERFNERIVIGNRQIEDDVFADIATRVRAAAESMVKDGLVHPTFFELVTACGFLAFAEAKVDVAVIEVGLGGRLDATNVLNPKVSVIASIGLDHTKVLGETVEEIAREKAGIIKADTPVVIYPQPSSEAYAELLMKAREMNAPVYSVRDTSLLVKQESLAGQTFRMRCQGMDLGDFTTSLLGPHQVLNAATAVMTSLVLNQEMGLDLTMSALKKGVAEARWPGRLEYFPGEPDIIMDGAHNPQGIGQLANVLDRVTPNHDAVILFGACKTKDVEQVARLLSQKGGRFIITQPPVDKALPAVETVEIFRGHGAAAEVEEDPKKALVRAEELAKALNVPLVITGSLYLVGCLRGTVKSKA